MKSGQKRDVIVSQNVGIRISGLICLACPTSSTQSHRTTIQAVIKLNILHLCVPLKHLGIIFDQIVGLGRMDGPLAVSLEQ